MSHEIEYFLKCGLEELGDVRKGLTGLCFPLDRINDEEYTYRLKVGARDACYPHIIFNGDRRIGDPFLFNGSIESVHHDC